MNIVDRIGKYIQPGRSWHTRNVSVIKVFSVHHDAIPQGKTADEVLQQIYNIHKAKGWPGISYHYYIHSDGTIYQLNKHEWVTWIDGVNWDAIGIVVNGYLHPNINNKPTNKELASTKWLLDKLSTQHPEFPADQNDTYGHRERAQTSCPGDHFFPYVKEYRLKSGDVNWGENPAPAPTPSPNPVDPNYVTGNDDPNQISINLDQFGWMERQAIKGKIGDVERLQNENGLLRKKIDQAKQALA